jgi:hypothetical protein
MTPDFAVEKWHELVQPYAGQAKLGAPSVSNSETPGMGLDWLETFLNKCSDCTIDFIPIHWYAESGDFEYFKQCVTNAHDVAKAAGFDVPVWVTEFGAPTPNVDVQVDFVNKATSWMGMCTLYPFGSK